MHTITEEMTAEQKFSELLKELGSLIREKNDLISLQAYRIKCLEAEIEELKKSINKEGE